MVLAMLTSASRAQNTIVIGQVNPAKSTQVKTAAGGVGQRTSSGGKYSIHAGALVVGAPAPSPDVKHIPAAGQPAEANVLPVGIANPRDEIPKQRAAFVPLANGKTYATNDKNFTSPPNARMVNMTPVATNAVTTAAKNPFPAFTTTATAQAKVFFEEDPAKVYNVNPMGTMIKLENLTQAVRVGNAIQTRSGPDATSATLVLDPLNFPNITQGDTLRSVVGLSRSDFMMQNNDPRGLLTTLDQAGTNLLGSPSTLGNDFQGDPLIYQLRLTLLSNTRPIVEFAHDIDSRITFFNPDDPLETPLSNPDAFAVSRFNSFLDPLANPGDLFTLTGDFNLIGWKADAPQDLSNLSVTSETGMIATAVPEPFSLTLLALGGLGVFLANRIGRLPRTRCKGLASA
jgi:hypothetical protein